MEGAYEKGNCCVAGGDFNKDLLGDSGIYFAAGDADCTWAQPIPHGTFDGFHITLVPRWTGSTRFPPAATPTAPITRGSMWSLWTAFWSPTM